MSIPISIPIPSLLSSHAGVSPKLDPLQSLKLDISQFKHGKTAEQVKKWAIKFFLFVAAAAVAVVVAGAFVATFPVSLGTVPLALLGEVSLVSLIAAGSGVFSALAAGLLYRSARNSRELNDLIDDIEIALSESENKMISELSTNIDKLYQIALDSNNKKLKDVLWRAGAKDKYGMSILFSFTKETTKDEYIKIVNGIIPEILTNLINEGNIHDETALDWAVHSGVVEVTKILLDKNRNINKQNNISGKTLLYRAACQQGTTANVEILKLLLDKNPDLELKTAISFGQKTALLRSISDKHCDMTKLLLSAGADSNVKDAIGNTMLLFLLEQEWFKPGNGLFEIANELIAKSNIDEAASDGNTALILAARKGNVDLVAEILKKKPSLDVKNSSGNTALHEAVNPVITKLLLDAGANPNIKNNSGDTPLSVKLKDRSFLTAIELIKSKKTDIDIVDKDGNSPLIRAVSLENNDLVKEVLAREPKLEIKNASQQTALKIASLKNNETIKDMLLNAGAKDEYGRTQLMRALINMDETLINKLLDKSNLNETDNFGYTALYYACLNDQIKIPKLLLLKGADPTIIDKKGKTLLFNILNKPKVLCFLLGDEVYFDILSEIKTKGLTFEQHMDQIQDACTSFLKKSSNKSQVLPLLFLLSDRNITREVLKKMKEEDKQKGYKLLENMYPNISMNWLKETHIDIDPKHFKKPIASSVIPKLKDKIVDFKKILLDKFDSIKFDNSKKSGSRDPLTLKDDGSPTTKEKLRKYLNIFISRIENKTNFTATPPAGTPELIEYYDSLENIVKHIALKLEDPDIDDDAKISAVIDLAIAGNHCGARYKSETQALYKLLSPKIEVQTMEDYIAEALQKYRLGILEQIVVLHSDSRRNPGLYRPHLYNEYLLLIGKERGIPGFESISKIDPYYLSIKKEKGLKAFDRLYNPTVVIDQILELNRDEIGRWLKEKAILPEPMQKEIISKTDELREKISVKQKELDEMPTEVFNKYLDEYINDNFLKGLGIGSVKSTYKWENIEEAINNKLDTLNEGQIKTRLEKSKEKLKKDFESIVSRDNYSKKILNRLVGKVLTGDDIQADVIDPTKFENIKTYVESYYRDSFFEKEYVNPETGKIQRDKIVKELLIPLGILSIEPSLK